MPDLFGKHGKLEFPRLFELTALAVEFRLESIHHVPAVVQFGEGVGHGVEQDVGVAVARQPGLAGELDAAQTEQVKVIRDCGNDLLGFVDDLPYGWRALYALGGLPLLALAWLRRSLPETRRFEAQLEPGVDRGSWFQPIVHLVRMYPRRILLLGLALAPVRRRAAWLLPLLVLRQNIYNDPQRPMQAEAKIYEFGSPGPDAPFFITTNFAAFGFGVPCTVMSA